MNTNIRFITTYKKGLIKNYKKLKEHSLHNKDSNSYFKYLYDKLDSGYSILEPISSIIAFNENNDEPIAVLLFFHSLDLKIQRYEFLNYSRIGIIGVFVKEEYREKGIAKKLIKEFEKNFIDIYTQSLDYVIVDAVENAYPIAENVFDWFIPCNKRNSDEASLEFLVRAIYNGKRSLKYYQYKKNLSLY